ncbi:MAG: ABC transporter ATP-binding protein/permease [Christensenellaceae bacterium]|jgi:ATP-binding cassette subfamily B protein|nr:ABC transporter ATP-binding protein/permease [Christensenellaceae bacterium]
MSEKKSGPPMGGGPGGRMRVAEKPKNFKKSIGKLLKYLKPMRVILVVALTLVVMASVISILGPKISINITDEITNVLKGLPIDMGVIIYFSLIVLGMYVLSAIFNFIQSFIFAGITAKITKKLRSEMIEKINKLPLKYYDNNLYGDTLSRITNDIDTIAQTLNMSLSSLVMACVTAIGIPVLMFTINVKWTLIALGVVLLVLVGMFVIIKISQKYFIRQQRSLGEVNGHIEEVFSSHTVVKVFNGEKRALEKFDEGNGKLFASAYKSQFLSGLMMPMMRAVGSINMVLIALVAGMEVISTGNYSLLAALPFFIVYINRLNEPLQNLATSASTLQQTAAASERVFEFLDETEQQDESEKVITIPEVKGLVEFKNVSFGYNPDKEVIHDFSCVAKPGYKVAIVGPTGAGKTTIVNLLMRFYETTGGEITIDGVSIKDMNREFVRSLFGMVLQDTWLFEGTIKENMAFGNPSTTQEQIEQACQAANIDHFIKAQPKGYDMMLSEESNLSVGEKQLFTIARAMVQNAPMLILDEATSSVDTRTEEQIQKAMDKLMKGRTSFVIAHRLSTIKNADLILVMKDGNIIESGTHKELIVRGGFYAELYNSQFSKNSVEIVDEEDLPQGDVVVAT